MESERSISDAALLILLVEDVELVELGIVLLALVPPTERGLALLRCACLCWGIFYPSSYLYRPFLFTDVKPPLISFHATC